MFVTNMRLIASIGILAVLAACGGGGDASTTSPSGGGAGGTGTTTTTGGGAGGTTTTTTGGTTTTSAVVDKYIGTWVSCTATGASSSDQETLVLQKASDTTVNFSSSVKNFTTTTNCSGTVTAGPTVSGTATWVGTKLVGSETVDKINIVQGTVTLKQIIVIRSDGKLYSGVEASSGGPVDADGYPTTLQTTGSTKTA